MKYPGYSHFVLACDACANLHFAGTLQTFRNLTRYHGLPEIIRCDLGSPFASNGLGRLSSLSLWWIEKASRWSSCTRPRCRRTDLTSVCTAI